MGGLASAASGRHGTAGAVADTIDPVLIDATAHVRPPNGDVVETMDPFVCTAAGIHSIGLAGDITIDPVIADGIAMVGVSGLGDILAGDFVLWSDTEEGESASADIVMADFVIGGKLTFYSMAPAYGRIQKVSRESRLRAIAAENRKIRVSA